VAEAFAALSSFKSMLDMAKGLKDISDAATRNAVAIEIQEKILSAQAAQMGLVERVSELEKEVAGFETWDAEKQRYELKNVGYTAFAYMLKPAERGVCPPHWVCAHCYEQRHIQIIQFIMAPQNQGQRCRCPSCKNDIMPSANMNYVVRGRWRI
jgi:hypothetical protein